MERLLKNIRRFFLGDSEEDIQEKIREAHKRRMSRTKKRRKKK